MDMTPAIINRIVKGSVNWIRNFLISLSFSFSFKTFLPYFLILKLAYELLNPLLVVFNSLNTLSILLFSHFIFHPQKYKKAYP